MSSDHRACKKLAMCKKIRHAALDLSTVNGFDSIAVEQIANAVDVSLMTFYRHFGTRETVTVDVILTGNIGQAIHHEATLAPVAGIPEEVVGMVDSILGDSAGWIDDFARRLKLVHDSPRLQDLLWQQTTTWIAALETLLAGDGPGTHAHVRAIVSVDAEACLTWSDREGFPSTSALHQRLQEAAGIPG